VSGVSRCVRDVTRAVAVCAVDSAAECAGDLGFVSREQAVYSCSKIFLRFSEQISGD
jgi:hypothetical protein